MAFLYVTYIVLYAVLGTVLGRVIDAAAGKGDIHPALKDVGGVMYTVVAFILMAATFIPKGAFALNPEIIDNVEIREDEVDGELAAYMDDLKTSHQGHKQEVRETKV